MYYVKLVLYYVQLFIYLLTCTDPMTQPVTSSQNPSTVAIQIAQKNIRMIKERFSTLVTVSCERLQSRKIKIQTVKMFLVLMYGNDITRKIESANSLDEIFHELSKHGLWNYLNYYLLESIINKFAQKDNELKRMMEEYKHYLTGHILTQKIETYLNATHYEHTMTDSDKSADEIISTLPPEQKSKLFKELTTKCDSMVVTDHTLSYVNTLWQSLAQQFELPQLTLILHDIAEGRITWLIPAELTQRVIKMANETGNVFSKDVLKVTLDEKRIYPPLDTETTMHKRKVGSTMTLIGDLYYL